MLTFAEGALPDFPLQGPCSYPSFATQWLVFTPPHWIGFAPPLTGCSRLRGDFAAGFPVAGPIRGSA